MKRYDKYKDSGVSWIGKIPEHWEVKKIKHRCYVKARVGWKGLKSTEFLSEGYSYLVTGSDFKNDSVDWKECYHIDRYRYEEDPYIQLQNEDLLITKDGTIGKLAIVSKLDKPACLNSGIFVVRSLNEDFKTRFLFWILKSNVFSQFNNYTKYGSTIQHLYQNIFVEFSFPFPRKQEQTAIANYLDRKTAEIDQLIEEKKQLIALYKEEKTAIINQAVTKGINPNVKLKDSGIEWLGEIPAHWGIKRLKHIAHIQTGRTPKISGSSTDNFTNGNINWYTPGDFKEGKFLNNSKRKLTEEAIKENNIELFEEYTIYLVSIGATLGKISLSKSKAYSNQQINAILFNRKYVNPIFGYFFIKGNPEMLLIEADYTTLGILNQNKLKNIFIALPPNTEQTQIVQYIEKETARIDDKIDKAEKYIELLAEYRQALISEVVTGKVKVIN